MSLGRNSLKRADDAAYQIRDGGLPPFACLMGIVQKTTIDTDRAGGEILVVRLRDETCASLTPFEAFACQAAESKGKLSSTQRLS
jgi:hypothetical protein